MNNLYTFFNYNWFKIIKENIKNNKIKTIEKKEKKLTSKLILKKEICALVFVILNFLITYTSSIEIYKSRFQNNIFMHIFKDNISTTIIWFIILTILPLITNIMITKKIKSKHYLLLSLIYLLSNLFNITLIIYFITEFINNKILGIIGILNIIITIIINSSIIIKLNENYLK